MRSLEKQLEQKVAQFHFGLSPLFFLHRNRRLLYYYSITHCCKYVTTLLDMAEFGCETIKQ